MPGPAIHDDLRSQVPPGNATPTRKSTRKQTILSLVEELLKTGPDSEDVIEGDSSEQRNLEDDRDVPTVDERLQVLGAEEFSRFSRRINNLDKELRSFANASRQLGSSVGILSSAFHLRERLAQILFLFRENASDLFPRKVQKRSRETIVDEDFRRLKHKAHGRHAPNHVTRLTRPTIDEDLDLESFPVQLDALAFDVVTFLNCLNEFPEFTDEAVNASIKSFEADLKYWASCLEDYRGQFRYPAVQRYIHDLTYEMGDHLDNIISTLSMFIEVGVPTIKLAQKHGATNLLNLSTVATFFSAVTATTLQFSYELTDGYLQQTVNTFWFASLVFSIAAAVNSLLGLTWKQAMYRSPGHRVPWWVLIWIKRSPLVFLIMSVMCFSIGLVLFAYASEQGHVTSTATTVLTAFTSFGLAAVSTWFASERYIFIRHRGKKWLADVLLDVKESFFTLPGMKYVRSSFYVAVQQMMRVRSFLGSFALQSLNLFRRCWARDRYTDSDDVESGRSINSPTTPPSSPEPLPSPRLRLSEADTLVFGTEPKQSLVMLASPSPDASPVTPQNAPAIDNSPTRGKQLWINAVRTVRTHTAIMRPTMTGSGSQRITPHRKRTTSSSMNVANGFDRKRTSDEPVKSVSKSRVAALVPKLKNLETTQDLEAHSALVRHLQFSPDGKYLATSSWDRTSVIFSVGREFSSHRVLAHAKGFVGQVAWSPKGDTLLTKLARGIKIWNVDGVCKKTIDRPRLIESMNWFPGGDAILSVEGSYAVKLDLNGNLLEEYHFERMKLHDVAVAPDGERLLGVGPLIASPSGLQPSKSRVEKRLVVFNMATQQYENQTPVLNDVRDITIARNGLVALVSYENKAPPQLWKLEYVKDRENNSIVTGRLTLRHTYMPKLQVDFAGPSYFGGKEDELVLCAGKAGDIHIWDRESGSLLHHVRAQALGGDLTCIAWNHAADDPFMFATGSHDGAVRIWTRPSPGSSVIHVPMETDEQSHAGGSAIPTRSTSPVDYDFSRTDSPLTQQDGDSFGTRDSSQAPMLKEKAVAFANTSEQTAAG